MPVMSDIPTTDEMDGRFTEEDIANKNLVMKPCIDCSKFNEQKMGESDAPCRFCGGAMVLHSTYWMSIRTYRPDRKVPASARKKAK